MKHLRSKILALLVAVSLIGAFVVATDALAGKTITIKGSTTVLPIAQVCAEEYMRKNPSAYISVQGGGSGVGIAGIVDGTCDIGDASRPIKDKELEQAVSRGVSPKAHVVAMDGIAVVVHPSNSVSAFTKQQIKDIYTGKVSNWSEVGGSGGEIVVISRDSASGTFEAFNGLALDKEKVRPDALLEASNQAVAGTVAKTPGAIGYIGLGYVTYQVKAIPVNGIECTKETVLSGKYPFARPLFMYTNGKPTGEVEGFLNFVLSDSGQDLVEDAGFVGLQ
ncbi:MAG: phosphate ABC transporter substrate-binding protein [Candidatus Omnitrophica bacterium]|nr:phosphate ABC transporter substrate-binding protein [Candidatus Omnitrophota bacterium]